MTAPKKRSKLLDDPLAVTSAGKMAVNVTHLDGMSHVIAAAEKLVPEGSQLFVGVVVPRGLRRKLVKELDDAVADVVGRVGPKLTEASPAGPRTPGRRSGRR